MSDAPLFGPDDRVDDVEALLRELDSSDLEMATPPADIWGGIEAELGDELDAPRPDVGGHDRGDHDRSEHSGTVVSLASRRPRLTSALLATAAAVALIAIGAVVVTSIGGGGDTTVATAALVHEADFDPLGTDASATAKLVERDGSFEIELDDATLPDPDANDLELWLIAAAADGSLDVQPVALVDPASPGTYAVPAGLDPDVYSIVDISIEPRDGDETHSGRSILRGTLTDV